MKRKKNVSRTQKAARHLSKVSDLTYQQALTRLTNSGSPLPPLDTPGQVAAFLEASTATATSEPKGSSVESTLDVVEWLVESGGGERLAGPLPESEARALAKQMGERLVVRTFSDGVLDEDRLVWDYHPHELTEEPVCSECGHRVAPDPDGSPGVLVHERAVQGDLEAGEVFVDPFDLDADHTPILEPKGADPESIGATCRFCGLDAGASYHLAGVIEEPDNVVCDNCWDPRLS